MELTVSFSKTLYLKYFCEKEVENFKKQWNKFFSYSPSYFSGKFYTTIFGIEEICEIKNMKLVDILENISNMCFYHHYCLNNIFWDYDITLWIYLIEDL